MTAKPAMGFGIYTETGKLVDVTPGQFYAQEIAGIQAAYSDEAGQRFRSITGHPFRFHSGRASDLKPATFEHHLGRC